MANITDKEAAAVVDFAEKLGVALGLLLLIIEPSTIDPVSKIKESWKEAGEAFVGLIKSLED